MDFRTLEEAHQTWQEIRVIGRTIERKDKKYHIVGMTLADEVKLYILEPYEESEHGRHRRKGIRNHRRILKEQENPDVCYLHCSDIYLGKERLQVQGGSSGPLMESGRRLIEANRFKFERSRWKECPAGSFFVYRFLFLSDYTPVDFENSFGFYTGA